MSNDQITKASDRPIWLTSLAEADSGTSPDSAIEARLQAALRRRRSMSWAKRAGAVALAASLATGLWFIPKRVLVPVALDDQNDDSLTAVMADAQNLPGDDELAVSDFIPTRLASEQPLESVHLVRVSLPGAALAHYGVPPEYSSASEVTADLLVGQDGIARAIRIVR